MEVSSFKRAMLADMERKELSEAGVGKLLGLSQQGVHKWLERGFPPMHRLPALIEVLGENGEVAKLTPQEMFGDRVTRTPKLPPAETTPNRRELGIATRSSLAQQYNLDQDAAFRAHLPPALLKNTEVQFFTKEFGVAGRIDYASPNLVVEISHAHGMVWSQSWSAAVLRTMLYRDLVSPQARAVFMLVSDDDEVRFPKLVTLASEKYNVDLVHVRSGAQAAAFVADAEGEDLVEPDDE